jgi:hypothetical protein
MRTHLCLTRVTEPNESVPDVSCPILVPENNPMDVDNPEIGISNFNPRSPVTLMYF